MAFAMPLAVPKTRTVNLGGVVGSRETFGEVIRVQSKADLHSMLVGIATEDTRQQEQLNNPPQIVEVDNRTNKPLDQADRKIVILFGVQLARAAMRMVETELRQAINRSTVSRSGRLGNIGANWEWRYIPKGGSPRIVTAANPPPAFGRGDRLVLVPVNVPYASAVNRAVANSGRMNSHVNKGRKGALPKSAQNLGFLAATTRVVRRRSEFKQFTISAEHTTTHAVAGEGRKWGTGVIVIRARYRQVRV